MVKRLENEENTIVCRCSDVTLKELRDKIEEGYTNPDELKRVLRIGMGPCQGRTCGMIVLRELANYTGKSMGEIKSFTARPPVLGVKIEDIAKALEGGDTDENQR